MGDAANRKKYDADRGSGISRKNPNVKTGNVKRGNVKRGKRFGALTTRKITLTLINSTIVALVLGFAALKDFKKISSIHEEDKKT